MAALIIVRMFDGYEVDTCPAATTSKPWFRSARKTKSKKLEIAMQKKCKAQRENSCLILRNLTHCEIPLHLTNTDRCFEPVCKSGPQKSINYPWHPASSENTLVRSTILRTV